MRKLLIYSIITFISIISVFLANYAMVFPLAAKIVSGFALLISLLHFLLVLFHPNGWLDGDKNFLGMWVGPLLYSMNKLMSPITILILLSAQKVLLRWMNMDKKMKTNPKGWFDKWKLASSELMWISLCYFILDVCREYTIWHDFQFKALPTLLLVGVMINWMIFSKKWS